MRRGCSPQFRSASSTSNPPHFTQSHSQQLSRGMTGFSQGEDAQEQALSLQGSSAMNSSFPWEQNQIPNLPVLPFNSGEPGIAELSINASHSSAPFVLHWVSSSFLAPVPNGFIHMSIPAEQGSLHVPKTKPVTQSCSKKSCFCSTGSETVRGQAFGTMLVFGVLASSPVPAVPEQGGDKATAAGIQGFSQPSSPRQQTCPPSSVWGSGG